VIASTRIRTFALTTFAFVDFFTVVSCIDPCPSCWRRRFDAPPLVLGRSDLPNQSASGSAGLSGAASDERV